ncbi:carbohydrate porin [Azotobacter vinelandii]
MKKTKKALLLTSICIMFPLSAQAWNYSGYYRLGFAGSADGHTQSCFKLPGAGSKYRLGNECEEYFEPVLQHDLLSFDDGSTLGFYTMGQVFNDYGHKLRFSDDWGYTRLAQWYAEWKNMPALNGGNFWIGRRWYNRNNVHISDFWYWNQSGTGFAFDKVGIGGDLTLSYVFSRKDNQDQDPYVNRHDLTLEGIATNPGGELQWGVSYLQKPDSRDAHSGWSTTLQHKQEDVLGGFNTLAVQYGQASGTNISYTGDTTQGTGSKTWRLVEILDWQTSPRFSGQFGVVYQRDIRPEGGGQHWLSIGARPVYGLGHQFKLAVEVGHDRVRASDGTRTLTKITIAPTWSPKGPGFLDRPEVRFYYTYAFWNKEAQRAANQMSPGSALSDTGVFGSDRNGANFGIQFEHWWD